MTVSVKQIIGVILIAIGFILLYYDISSSYYYFNAEKEFPQVFAEPVVEQTSQTSANGSTNLQDQMSAIMGEQIGKLMPANTVTGLLNVSSWILFATFLVYAAGKIIAIGSDFLKKDREIIKIEKANSGTEPPFPSQLT
jgi:preprotein translocase subunit SecG